MVFKKKLRKRVRRARKSMKLVKWPEPTNTLLKTKVMAWIPVITVAAGTYAYSFPINFPIKHVNNAATYGSMTNVPANFAGLLAMFDEYRVEKVVLKFMSNCVDVVVPTADFPNICYIVNDNDDVVQLTEPLALNTGALPIRIENTNNVVRTFRQPKSKRHRYLNTSVANTTPTTNILANISLFEDPFGSIKILFPNTAATTCLGRIYVEWYVEFKGLRNA